jgi:hypothetical protein
MPYLQSISSLIVAAAWRASCDIEPAKQSILLT